MNLFDNGNLTFERLVQAVVQRHETVFGSFTVKNVQSAAFKVYIQNAQAETFDRADTTAIHQLGHQLILRLFDVIQEEADFVFGEDDGDTNRFLGAQGINVCQRFIEDVLVHKEDGAEGLILGRSSYILVNSQMGEELFDFGSAHFGRVAFLVEKDEAFAPLDINFFGADGVMFQADFGA